MLGESQPVSRIVTELIICGLLLLLAGTAYSFEPLFDARLDYHLYYGPYSVLSTDLDGDGYADLAVAGRSPDYVSVLLNNGDGTFAIAVNYDAGEYPSSVFSADLDGDGDGDLAVANYYSDDVSVLLNHGDGTFAAAVDYGVGPYPYSVFSVDLDGDGDSDLAVANSGSDNVSVLLNSGNGTFTTAVDYGVGDYPISVFSADLDGDGDGDLAVANKSSHNVSVLMNNGDGTLAVAANYGTGLNPSSVVSSDLDGDGDSDLAVANNNSDDVTVLLNHGDGTFAAAVNYGAGDYPQSVYAADLDGDSDSDLAVANGHSNDVSVFLNDGSGTFVAAAKYNAGSLPSSVFSADLDGDGDGDLAVANKSSHNVSVLINDGGGTFAAAAKYDAGESPYSVLSLDLDDDGDNDLAVANRGSDNVSVIINHGDGTFAMAVNYGAGDGPNSVFSADMDDDGDSDLAVTNIYSYNVSVLLNNGDGTFAAAANYGTGAYPFSVFSTDLDGDGDSDLAVANRASYNVSVLKNHGDGTFAAAVNYGAGSYPSAVYATDLDGDGDNDLAVPNWGSDDVSILLNNGDGTFAWDVKYSVGANPSSVVSVDLDGDSDIDLVVANQNSDNVSAILNNGDGTFAAATNYGVGEGPISVFSVDLDGDGDKDLATANMLSYNVSVLFNNGDGTLGAVINYGAGDGPYSVFSADLAGDGDSDLIVSNSNSDDVSVLLNRTYSGGPGFCEDFAGLFCDDFEDGILTGWQTLSGYCVWSESDGFLSTSETGSTEWCIQSAGDGSWDNIIFEGKVRGNGGVDKVLVFRIQDENNFYAVNLRSDYPTPDMDQVTFDKMAGGVYQADIITGNFPSTSGTWYSLRIECLGNDFHVDVNSTRILEYTDNDNPWYAGGIGLACWTGYYGACDISFDNVSVTEPVTPHIHLNKGSLSFSVEQGGALPANQAITITNVGGGTLDWYIDEQIDWLDLDIWQGPGNSQEITVSINSTSLAPGTYNEIMTATSNNADNSPQYVDVVYTVSEQQPTSVSCEILEPDEDFVALLGYPEHVTALVRDNFGDPITGADLQSIVAAFTGSTPFVSLYDDGLHGDESADDGIYGADFTPADVGALTMVVTADHTSLGLATDTRGGAVYNAVSTVELRDKFAELKDQVRSYVSSTVIMSSFFSAKGFDRVYEDDFEEGVNFASSLLHLAAGYELEVLRYDILNIFREHPQGIEGSLMVLATKLGWMAIEMQETNLINQFASAMDGSEFPLLSLSARETYLRGLYQDQTIIISDIEERTFSSFVELRSDIDQCFQSVSIPDYLPDVANVERLVDELERVRRAFEEATPADAGRIPGIEREVVWKLPRAGNCDITGANHFVVGSCNEICRMFGEELEEADANDKFGDAVSLGCLLISVGAFLLTVFFAPTVVGSALFASVMLTSGTVCLENTVTSGTIEMLAKYEMGAYVLDLNSAWPDDIARGHAYFGKICSDIQELVDDPMPGDCSNNVELVSVTSPDICYMSAATRIGFADVTLKNHDAENDAIGVAVLEVWAEDEDGQDKLISVYHSGPIIVDPGMTNVAGIMYSAPPVDGFLGLGKNYYDSRFRVLTSGLDYDAQSSFRCVNAWRCELLGESDNKGTILQDFVSQDQELVSSYVSGSGTVFSSVSMGYHGSDVDLHIYDASNNHVGHNYQTGMDEILIPGASYSGHESNPETISLPNPGGSAYQVMVKGISVVDSEYVHISFFEQGPHPAILAPTRESVDLQGKKGDSIGFLLGLKEIGSQQPVENIQVSLTALTDSVSDTIPSAAIHMSAFPATIQPDSSVMLESYLKVPIDADTGVYSGVTSVSSSGGSFDVPIILGIDTSSGGCCYGVRGNVDGDVFDGIDISDLVWLVDYMFTGGPAPACWEEGDIDGSGVAPIDITDLVYLVDYMFNSGPAPLPCP